MPTTAPELVILAPAAPDRVYTEHVRQFVETGVHFEFGDDYSLPRDLPASLDGVRCIMIDAARQAEFQRPPLAAKLHAFAQSGGYVYYPDPKTLVGGGIGDSHVRPVVLRAISTAGLTSPHPRMIQRLQNLSESALLAACKVSAAEELRQYVGMKMPFVDPVGMWTLPAAVEAAEYFDAPELAEPVWSHIKEHYATTGYHFDTHGTTYFLDYARRTSDRRPIEHLLSRCSAANPWPYQWRLDGVYLNCNLRVPDGSDPDQPPPTVRENVWVWPETGLSPGEAFAVLSQATGDSRWLDCAITHLLKAHRWLFDPQTALYWHVGRPAGPDKRSAPWARGDSHFLWSVRTVLNLTPEAHPRRAELIDCLRVNLEGLLRTQDPLGLWNNVLDAAPGDSRPCSSATSQFIRVYARAYWKGWLRDPRVPEMLERAWRGFRTKIWEHLAIAWCVGTGHSLVRQMYYARPHDSFRSCRSAILHAWIEMQKMRKVG